MRIQRVHPQAKLPVYATAGAACFDLHAVEAGTVPPRRAHTFATGLKVEVPEGHVMLIFSRSGHGFVHDVRLANCVGVIDADYRGEVMVRLTNDKNVAFSFEPGDRIAQALVIPIRRTEFEEATDLSPTARGEGGFGSTGA